MRRILTTILASVFALSVRADLNPLLSQNFTGHTATSAGINPYELGNTDWWRCYGQPKDFTSELNEPSTNFSLKFGGSSSGANKGRTIVSPPISGNIGAVTFRVNGITRKNITAVDETVSVFLGTQTNYKDCTGWPNLSSVLPGSIRTATVPESCRGNWTDITVYLNTQVPAETPMRVAIGFMNTDGASFDIYIDDIVIYEMPSSMVESAALSTEEGLDYALSGIPGDLNSVHPVVSFLTVGEVSNASVKLYYRTTGSSTWAERNMYQDGAVWRVEANTIDVGTTSGVQLEMYVAATYDNEEGEQTAQMTYTEENPFVLDILPRWNNDGHESLVIDGAFNAPMFLTTNCIWVGAYEREGGVQGETYRYCFGEDKSIFFGNANSKIPGEGSLHQSTYSPAPSSIDRDIIFRYSEVDSPIGSVFFAEYESFENWQTNDVWQVVTAPESDSGLVTNPTLAHQGSNAFLLRAGDTLILDKTDPLTVGVGEIGFWARRAGTDPVSITVNRHRKGMADSPEFYAMFTGLPTDRYAYFGKVIEAAQDPMSTDKIYFTANSDVYLDGVFASDCSSVQFESLIIEPSPIRQGEPITLTATYKLLGGGKVKSENVKLCYGQGFNESCTTNENAFSTIDDGVTWTCTLSSGVEFSNSDFYARIECVALDYKNFAIGDVKSPTFCVPVIPNSDVDSVTIEDGTTSTEMRLATEKLWKGALTKPTEASKTYYFLDSDGVKRGDASATTAPARGDLVQDEEFALNNLSTDLAFEYNEAEQTYRVQMANYAPMRDATQPTGWTYMGQEASTEFDGCAKFNANGTITTPVRDGVGQISFWAARTSSGPAQYTISVSKTNDKSDFVALANGGTGVIASQNMRFFNAVIGDPEVKRVQIKFINAAAFVQEVIVTASGSFVTMSNPTISLDDGATFSPSDAAHTLLGYGGRPYMTIDLAPMSGAHNVRVFVEAVMADLTNGVAIPVQGANIVSTPMDNGTPGVDGGTYRVWMPALTAGVTAYRFVAEYDGEDATLSTFPKVYDTWYFYETSDELAIEREADFQKFEHKNAIYSRAQDGWSLTDMYMWTAAQASAGFVPTAGRSILRSSRAFNGIGRIYFRAFTTEKFGYHDLEVQTSTNGNKWETINTIDVPYGEGTGMIPFSQIVIEVNDYSSKYIRFVRASEGTTDEDYIYIRDIVVTPPAANMTAVMPSIIHPGYPSKNDDITFAVDVANVYEDYPAVNARVTLMWRRVFGSVRQAWNATPMSSTDGNHFTVTLPAMNPGKLEYYAQVAFSGASYRYVYSNRSSTEEMPIRFYYAFDDAYLDADPRQGNESCTPAYIYSDVISPAEFTHTTEQRALEAPSEYENRFLWFRVRAFESQHDHLQVVYTNVLDVVEATEVQPTYTNALQLIGDNLWLTTLNITNDLHCFMSLQGVSPYGGENTTEYLAEPTLWGDSAQDTINPPFASVANTADDELIEVNLGTSKPVTMMVRFDATTGSYQIRRAAYQDFNDWGADTDFFEDSLGLFNVQTYEQAFDGSPQFIETAMGSRTSGFDTDIVGDYSETDYYTARGWNLHAGEIIRERNPRLDRDDLIGNAAALITARGGYFQSESGIGANSQGIESISMRARASFGADGHTPYDRLGFGWENAYIAVSNLTVESISPGNAYVQVMGAYQDPYNYVAMRLTQRAIIDNRGTLPRVYQELIKVQNGVETTLAASYVMTKDFTGTTLVDNPNADKIYQGLLDGKEDWVVELDMSDGTLKGRAYIPNATSTEIYLTGSAPNMTGTVSVDTFDAVAFFRNVFVQPNGETGRLLDPTTWYLCGPQPGGSGESRWKTAMPYQTTGSILAITRPLPPLRYTVGIAKAGESANPPSGTAFETGAPITVDSLAYANRSRSVHYWGNAAVRIRPELSDANLVIDDVEVVDWRGRNLPEESPNDNRFWQAREAVVTTHNGSRMLALTTSRANPAARQMISTPEMLDGIGTISFNYEVVGGNVSFVVEHNIVGGAYGDNAGYAVARRIDAVSGEKGEVYQAIRLNQTGKIRVRVIQEDSAEDATLLLDNFFAKGFPEDDGRSWSAYNALIVAPTRNSMVDAKQFDEDVSTQTAFLNNSIDGDTRQNIAYREHLPFIQSPIIDTGVGEIAFWYRAWNPDLPNAGQISFWVAENPDDPDELWRQITEADLAIPERDPGMTDWEYEHTSAYISYTNQVASFRSLSEIRNGDYQYFSMELCNDTNFVLRICSDTNSSQRVAIDNVIVTEPVRASIEVLSVGMYPNAIPLGNEPVGFEVLLGNPRMNPTDIHVYADYHIGTNVWGVANWGQRPDAAIELVQDEDNPFLYRSAVGDMIPGLPVDSVVQYRIRVTYTGTFAAPVSSVAFENPSWYEPVDLNQTYAADGFSPYYFVFSCPTGCVYISEFNPSGTTVANDCEFVEIMGPNNASIAGWTLDIVSGGSDSMYEDSVLESYVFPENATFKPGESDSKGWGFYLIADPLDPESIDDDDKKGIFAGIIGRADLYLRDGETRNLPTPGALRLRRSMGAYVDRVCWGGDSSVPFEYMMDRGYTYIEARSSYGSSTPLKVYALDDMTKSSDTERIIGWRIADYGIVTPKEMNYATLLEILGECPYDFSEQFINASAEALSEYFDNHLPADFLCLLDLHDATELMKISIDNAELTIGSGFTFESLGDNSLVVTLKADALAALNLSTNETHTVSFDVDEGIDPSFQLVVIDTTPESGDKSSDVSIHIKSIEINDGTVVLTVSITNNEPDKSVQGWSWGIKGTTDLTDEFQLIGDLQPLSNDDLDTDLTRSIPVQDSDAAGFYQGVLDDGE